MYGVESKRSRWVGFRLVHARCPERDAPRVAKFSSGPMIDRKPRELLVLLAPSRRLQALDFKLRVWLSEKPVIARYFYSKRYIL